MNNELMVIKAQLINSQSRSFEMLSQLTSERDEAKKVIAQYERLIINYGEQLKISNASSQDVMTEIIRLTTPQLDVKCNPVKKVESKNDQD